MPSITKTTPSTNSGLIAALWVELKKAGRSKTLWLTALGFLFLALVGGLFIFILKDPELARRLGLLGAKAQFMGGTADWPGFFNLILLMASVGDLIIFGFILVWIFGREFGDKTYFDFLSLPTSRVTIAAAKLVTGLLWCMALTLWLFGAVLGWGAILQLPGWSLSLAAGALEHLLATAVMTVLLVIPFALTACLTRGYLPAIGGLFLVLILSQVFNTLGYSQFFPWAIPALYNGAAGEASVSPGLVSYILVSLVGITSALGLGLWWQRADQA